MSPLIFSDGTLDAAKIALDGLSRRQEAIANNVANVDTPGYRAQTVDFATAVKQALNKAEQLPLQKTNALHISSTSQAATIQLENRPGGTLRADQNDVDINAELVDLSETGLRYQALTQLSSKRLLLYKDLLAFR